MVQIFRKTARLGDFTLANANLTADEYTEVYRLQVPKKRIYAWGGGSIVNGVDDRETLKLDLKNSGGTSLEGSVRIKVADANKADADFVKEYITDDLQSGVQLGLRDDLPVGEDAYLIIEAQTNSGTFTVDSAQSTGSTPITVEFIQKRV